VEKTMQRDEALAILTRLRPELARIGVSRLELFGSVARNQATAESDVDVLIDLDAPDRYHAYLDARDCLTAAFGRPVDLVLRGALKPAARPIVEAEAIRVATGERSRATQ
jgi:predicted nucleotidyltransferase